MGISLHSGFNMQIFISKWNPRQSNTDWGHLWRLQKVDYEQSLLVHQACNNYNAREKWPHGKVASGCQRRAQKEGLPRKSGNLKYVLLSQCKNVLGHYSWGINRYLPMTYHKLKSLNLQCLSSCSILVSIPKNLIYVLRLEQIEMPFSRPLHSLKSPNRLWKWLNLPNVLLGKVEQKPECLCISRFAIQRHCWRTS